MGLNLNTLGRLEISWNDQPVTELTLRKSQALLIYLAFNPDTHDRSHLAGLLWSELPERNARRNLRHALHTLRSCLDPDLLDSNRLCAGLNPDIACRIDALEFTDGLMQARRYQREGEPDLAFRCMQQAVDLYRGDFLDDFNASDCVVFEEWMTRRRVHLRLQVVEALEALVKNWTQRGVYERALHYARRQLDLESLSETSHRQLMLLLALTGRRTAALAQYEACRHLLSEELGVEPLEETTALYHAIRSASSMPDELQTGRSPSRPLSLPFIGREQEHAALVTAWEAARHHKGRLTLVAGQAGVGKTRLLEEVLRYVEAHGSTILLGRCYEFGDTLPYQPLADALRNYFQGEQLELPSIWLAELSRLLPDLHQTHPKLPKVAHTNGEAARQRLFEAVTRLFLSLCENGRALCLFIDDLHWADPSTLDLLHYLVRHLGDAPIWMVGTYRPEETGWSHPLTRLRQGLGRDHRVMRLTVKALSDDAVRRLAQSLVGEQDGKKLGALLYRESQGNAFFLTETLSALEEEGALMPCSTSLSHNGNHEGRWIWSGEDASDTLPLSVQDVILQRVGRLSECAQRLLTLAAVTSQQFDVALLKSASGLDEDLIETSLEEWLTRYLVLSQSPASGIQYDFSHDKIRAVLYHHIDDELRGNLHYRVGEALERRFAHQVEEHAASLSYHFERAGSVDKALIYLPMAAAKAMAVYANEPALDYYRRALALCPTDDDRRWEILLQQADVYNRVGQYSNAIAIYQEVIEKGQTDGQARAYRGLAQIYRVRRDYDTARRCVAESRRLSVEANRPDINAGNDQNPQALRVLGEIEREQSNYTRAQTLFEAALNIYRNRKDTHGLADCYKGLGAILSAQGRYEAAIHRYQQATTIYRRFNDRSNVSVCLRGIGMANWRLRNYEASREASQESLMICSAIGDRLGEAASLNALGLVAIAQGDQRETQRCWTASVAIYQDLNLPKRTAPGLHNLGIYYMDVGEMTASRRCLEQALEINEATGSRRDQALDLGWLGKLHWLMGEYTIAARYLDRALSLDKEVGGAEEEDWHLIWRTAVACERQNLEAAEVYLKKAKRLSAQDSPNLKSYEVTRWCAAIKLAQGKIRSARRIGLKALKKAREEGANPSALGEILTLMGQIAGSDPWSEGRTSKEYFEEALLLLPDAVPTMYLRAIALFHYGDSLIKKGVEDAEGYVREAERIFERLGISMASIKRLGV